MKRGSDPARRRTKPLPRREILCTGIGASALLLLSRAGFAQKKPARSYRIGLLFPGSPGATAHLGEAFKRTLVDLGYTEGRDVAVESRHADGAVEKIPAVAAEMVRAKFDIIVSATDPGVAAVKRHTQTIPIVMVGATDPVGTGFVESLARPGGNVTGLSTMSAELSGKRVELIREIVPGIARIAFLWNPDVRGALFAYKETENAARAMRIQLQSVELTRGDDLEQALAAIAQQRAQALIAQAPNPVLFSRRDQIVGFAQRNRLPSMYGQNEFADAGGLISYGPSAAESYVQAARYVDKILKGAKPADLPVQQPTRFELVLNLKTAKALGITIPPSVMVRADRVIQ